MPKNISAADRKTLENKWAEEARLRNEAVAKETAVPAISSKTLRFELRKFGRHWNAYAFDGKKMVALMATPSLLTSAMEAIDDAMYNQATQ